jgi:adenine-specific DNA-methyltransferase
MDSIKTEILSDNSETTINSQQIETLKKHFPQCFDKDGNFMPEKLNEVVSDSGTAFSKESYGLNWLGKSYARLLANESPFTLLAEDKEHNQKPENSTSENLLIKGDNLEVLKHLKGAYSESIKMIYIDPPYNTGSDGFVYQDDRKFTPKELAKLAGIEVDEAKRILEFTQSKANSHSAWLTFMYPRLYIARDLLKDEGVIFISIDDNELAQLKYLCDEVFGEYNFEGHIHWRRRHNQPNDKTKMIGLVAEHILVYSKDKIKYKESGVGKVDLTGKFSNSDGDLRGDWATKPWKAGADQGGTKYKIKTPTGKVYEEVWMGDEETFQTLLKDKRIVFSKNGDGQPRKKYFKSERLDEGQCATNWWSHDVFGHNQNGSDELFKLFDGKSIFSNPKPIKLLKSLVNLSNAADSDIILDFFAGSGTTANAVMELNQSDNSSRKYICVQLSEPVDKTKAAYKAGYKTIFDITKARIEKSAEKIRSENPGYEGDLGFQIFETLPIFEGYLDNIERLEGEQTEIFNGSTLSDEELEHLLTTWKVYDGIPLTKVLVETDLAGYNAYRHDKVLYLMHQGFTTEALKTFLAKLDATDGSDKGFDVEKLVLFGYNFDSKHQLEINEAVRQYQNRKEKTVSVVVRY